MTMDVGPQSQAAVTSGASAPGGSAQKSGRQRNMILAGIGLGLLVRLLRDRRFYTYAITAVIVLVTGGKAANENRARSIERLIAWEKRQSQVLEGEVKRQSKRLERKAKREVKKVKEALPG
jgi:hypothetical protein